MNRLRLLASASLVASLAACQCISPASLKGFACEGDGQCGLEGYSCCPDNVCRLDCSGVADGSTEGGDGGPDAGGDDGGSPACGPTTCEGCCDGPVCRTGTSGSACGKAGEACGGCDPVDQKCVDGACQTLLANGAACTLASECASDFCVEGNCCDQKCDRVCGTCKAAGSEGRCVARAEGAAAASCSPFVCDGIHTLCPTSCTTIRQCITDRYCDSAGQCQAAKADGTACGSGVECLSTFCADGVCCDGPCSGSCDRCNLPGLEGQCKPASSGDPGSPSCGTYTCNGTLVDCPIPCAGGCPAGTWCSGAYCAATKALGLPCAASGECTSGICADGVCCDSACAGECDACSVAAGAAGNGTCTLLGAAKVCRAATNTCDVEERCSGTAAACPTDGFTAASTTCGTTQYGSWGVCTPPAGLACSVTGTQTRTRTDSTCDGLGSCRADAGSESASCSRATENTNCGTVSYGAWSACSYSDATCSSTGSRTRTKTEPLCQGGLCQTVTTTETDTAGCARTTEGTSCGAVSNGPWSACSYSDATCSTSGSRTRTNTGQLCHLDTCQTATSTETDTAGCARSTNGTSCGAGTVMGTWGSCGYANTCSTGGSRTRTVTTWACSGGTCGSTNSTDTDTAGCARSTDFAPCGAGITYGTWSGCSYASTCSTSGSRTRTVTTWACGGGVCGSSDSTDTDTAGCSRSTTGNSCGAGTTYGAWSSCSYADPTCSNSGSRTRSVTTWTCNSGGGGCGSSNSTDTDTAGCARSRDGFSCGTSSTSWGACTAAAGSCTGTQSGTRTDYACSGGSCGSTPVPVSQACTLGNGASCGSGVACSGGTCVCDTTTGCAGCCSGNLCRPGSAQHQCGMGGDICSDCGPIGGGSCCLGQMCDICGPL